MCGNCDNGGHRAVNQGCYKHSTLGLSEPLALQSWFKVTLFKAHCLFAAVTSVLNHKVITNIIRDAEFGQLTV